MDGLPAATLTPHERQLADAVARGMAIVFSPPQPTIRAALIRHLLLGNTVARGRGPAGVGWPGVRIKGARIDGPLDLADCARPGTGLPALALEDCDIPDVMDLAAARLSQLSIAGSRFGFLNLREADIDGPFDFSRAQGFDMQDCWIDGRGARFGGEILGRQARLRAPSIRRVVRTGEHRNALWLAGSRIHGNVRLTGAIGQQGRRFEAIGGVSFDGTQIHGDFSLTGAWLAAGEEDAFRAENAIIDGTLTLQHVVAEGVVWLRGLRTGGTVEISDARIFGDHPGGHGSRHAPRNQPLALIVSEAEIGGSMQLSPGLVADGVVSFRLSKVRGEVLAAGARLTNRSQDGRARALYATHAEIGASLILTGATVAGRMDIAGARIGGHLSLIGASLSNRTSDSIGKAVAAMNITVGGNADFGAPSLERSGIDTAGLPATAISGTVDLTGAQIAGELAFTGCRIDNPAPAGRRFQANNLGLAIVARQMRVAASVLLNGGFRACGALVFTGANVGRDMLCQHAMLENPDRSALYAKDIEIGDDLKLMDMSACGDLRFERAGITGSVMWRNLTLSLGAAAGPQPATAAKPQLPQPQLPPPHRPRWWRWVRRHWHKLVWARQLRLLRRVVQHTAACTVAFAAGARDALMALWRPRDAPSVDYHRRARLELSHARIGASLKCEGVHFGSPARIDLSGVHVSTLDLSQSHAWGRPVCEDKPCPIALDGLKYERIVFPALLTMQQTPATNPRLEADERLRRLVGIPVGCLRWAAPHAHPLADRLLDWVLRDADNANLPLGGAARPAEYGDALVAHPPSPQHGAALAAHAPPAQHAHAAAAPAPAVAASAGGRRRRDAPPRRFNPQPYRQVVRILRAQGFEEAARYIAIAEQWATPRRPLVRLGYGIYGTFFGFGLRPRRAVATLVAYVLAGAVLAMFALHDRLMVETPLIATSGFTMQKGPHGPTAARAFVEASRPAVTSTEIDCIDLTGNFPAGIADSVTYAMDTVLPFIPLHQETKCELDPQYHFLRLARAIYAVLGWIVISLSLLTVSGMLKRSDGEPS